MYDVISRAECLETVNEMCVNDALHDALVPLVQSVLLQMFSVQAALFLH
jgi:RAB protein geranylgeranyltransferase component A